MAESFIGKTIGKYQIVEHLGRGGMAEVYKAYQPALDRYVAVKLMHAFLSDDADFLGRFQREARAVASLRHPNIVQVYDFDVTDGIYYMVMEFIDGDTLKNRLQELANKNEKMQLEEALRITRGVASALAYAHKRDMVHRDVKPANVMLNQENQVILTDFGIAKILSGPQYTASGAMIGTPAYMSPEQGLGKAGDARSDIYSLGTMLFQMATGQLPYDADTPLAVVLKHVNDPMPIPSRLNPSLPTDVERVIFKAMAKNPDDRYQTADQFINHLDRIQAGQEIPDTFAETAGTFTRLAEPQPTMVAAPPMFKEAPDHPAKKARPKWLIPVIGIGVLLAVAILTGVVYGVSRIGRSETPTPTITAAVVAATVEVPSSTRPVSPTYTNTPAPSATPLDLVGAAATALAQQNATLTAQAPTKTPIPTPTSVPSATPTKACDYGFELVSFYTYNNPANYNQAENRTIAPIDSQFPIKVEVVNRSSCPWEDGVQLVWIEGQSFDAEQKLTSTTDVDIDGAIEFDTTMSSGAEAGLFVSIWELQLLDGIRIGDPLEIRIFLYEPVSPTPVEPTDTPTPETPETTGPLDFNYFVSNCEYAGPDWRCIMTLTPFGGGGQPYTFFVFDADQPVRYYGGNQEHFIQSRRCKPWIHEVKLQDDFGNQLSKDLYISPDPYFEGGCED